MVKKQGFYVCRRSTNRLWRKKIDALMDLYDPILLFGITMIFLLTIANASASSWDAGLNSGLKAYWKLDETSGANLFDSVNNINNGTSGGSVVVGNVLSKFGKAYNFTNFTNSNISLPNNMYDNVTTFNLTLNYWIYREQAFVGREGLWTYYSSTAGTDMESFVTAAVDNITLYGCGSNSLTGILPNTAIPLNTWTMITIQFSNDGAGEKAIYINGTKLYNRTATCVNSQSDFNRIGSPRSGDFPAYTSPLGIYDEIGWWNDRLTQSKITQLYNNGLGITYGLGPAITQNSPSDNYQSVGSVTFNCSSTATSGNNMTNLSLYVNGNINYTQQGANTINLSLYATQNFLKGLYNWSCGGFDSSDNFTLTTNRTFNISDYVINYENYSNSSFVGNTENFAINVSYSNSTYSNIQAYFNYNGTRYTSNINSYTNGALFSKSLTIPGALTQKNYTFYWELILYNGTYNYFNSTLHNQTVNTISLDDCSANTLLVLNYSLKDEKTQIPINGTLYNSSVEVQVQLFSYGNRQSLVNYTQNYSKNNNPKVCLATNLNNSLYSLDVTTRYTADEYASEYYYMQNATLTNSSIPYQINLFDLKSAESTEFLMTFKDKNFLTVDNAIISLNRKYISEGIFKSVEHTKTDAYGQGTGHFDTSYLYTITVTKNGELLATFDNIAIFCEDKVTGNCKINLYASSQIAAATDFYTYMNIGYNLNWDRNARLLTLIFQILDNSVATVVLNATKFDAYNNLTICTSSLTSSSGTITCSIPESYGNLTFFADIYKNGEFVSSSIYTITQRTTEIFSGNSVILVLGLILTIPLMLIPSTIGVVLGVVFGLILSIAILYTSGTWIGGTSWLIWIIIAAGIIIWKIQQRGQE